MIHKNTPALFYGLHILLGAACVLTFSLVYIVPLAFLLYVGKGKRLFALLSFAAGAVWSYFFYTLPSLPEEGTPVSGIFQVRSVSCQASPFARSYMYKGVIGGTPCRFYIPQNKPRPAADSDLKIEGILTSQGRHNYVLKKVRLEKTPSAYRMAEMRHQCHEKIHRYLKQALADDAAASFLSSMITGQVDERTLSLQFQKLGLQHILGVSGFQFVLLSGSLYALLRRLLPYKIAAATLLAAMTVYFLFLGDSPPVQRAWIGISLYLTGVILDLPTSPLNALGAALIASIALDPLAIEQIGFQLSFLCTGAILLVYPRIRNLLIKIFPTRTFEQARRMPLLDQHGYVALFLVRESVALNISVHLLSIPALLALFHRFPLLSIPYNLFFPFCATISYFLCLAGFLIPWIHPCNAWFTSGLLKIASDPPLIADFYLRTNACTFEAAVIAMTAFFGWALIRQEVEPVTKLSAAIKSPF